VERKNWFGLIETFLVMEAHETGRELDRYILEGFKDVRERRRFIKAFAQWLSHFHRIGLYHKDMKTCNILVSAEGEKWEFRLLDLEDVRLEKRVGEKDVFKNFLQLNTSIPNTIGAGDRLRFFRDYTRVHPIIRNRRMFLSRLFEKSRERGVVYVSSRGVIKEKAF
jgi:serine/threonine protein kinase